jgi:oligoendopeptidase F
MTETFVLAHELGHAGHFTLAQQHQNLLDSEAITQRLNLGSSLLLNR